MLFGRPHPSKPIFLWVTLIASTALLAAFVYVQVRPAPQEIDVSTQMSDAQRVYAHEVRTSVEPYVARHASLATAADADAFKKQTAALTRTLLALPVPERMQTIHLSMILQLTQISAALDAQQDANVDAHMETVRAIIRALPYE